MRARWTLAPLVLVLAACGGGGGGNATDAIPADPGVDLPALPDAADVPADAADAADAADVPADDADAADVVDAADVADAADDADVADAADVPADTADAPPEVPPPHGAYFAPGGGDFLDLPYPLDSRRRADGHLDLHDFPNPAGTPIIEQYVAAAEAALDGFSVLPVIFFRFGVAVDVSVLPEAYVPASADQAVQLLDCDAGGARIPLLWRWRGEAATYLPAGVLALRPVWGFPLVPGHTYAAVVTSSLKAADGSALERPPALDAAIAGDASVPATLGQAFARWSACTGTVPGLPGALVAGTMFTVADPTRELRVLRTAIRETLPPPVVTTLALVDTKPEYWLYEGRYDAPNFQSGTPPYDSGGGFVFDAGGAPVIQRTESMRFALTVPRSGDMPAGGWPLALVSHGTGGDYRTLVSGSHPTGKELAKVGIAALGIDQPLHGARCDPPLDDTLVSLYSFNFLNPDSARTTQRHSVVDEMSLVRLVESGGLSVPAATAASGRVEAFDPGNLLFFGHSQGGTTGGMLFGIEDRLRGGVLSASGGGISLVLLLKSQPVDFKTTLTDFLWMDDPDELDVFHPVIGLAQALTDATDPAAYASGYFAFGDGGRPRHVLQTQGMKDPYTPPPSGAVIAATAGYPVMEPVQDLPLGLSIKGMNPVSAPIRDNVETAGGKVTAALTQWPDDGHFPCFQNQATVDLYRAFLRSLADGSPVIGP